MEVLVQQWSPNSNVFVHWDTRETDVKSKVVAHQIHARTLANVPSFLTISNALVTQASTERHATWKASVSPTHAGTGECALRTLKVIRVLARLASWVKIANRNPSVYPSTRVKMEASVLKI